MTLPTITFRKAKFYTLGRTEPIRAIVNHRMVGTLPGTDAYFTTSTTRPVSTHFGIGFTVSGALAISQYVPLDDTAYGNGNYDASGNWDNWGYKTTEINAQTVSIEHQDHDGTEANKGIVKEAAQQASIALQALLLRGTEAEWRSAGIILRDWTNFKILREELGKIIPGSRTIITHNDISGALKPYCWKPWANDTVGFPRQKYIDGIVALLAERERKYTQAELDAAVTAAVTAERKKWEAWLLTAPAK